MLLKLVYPFEAAISLFYGCCFTAASNGGKYSDSVVSMHGVAYKSLMNYPLHNTELFVFNHVIFREQIHQMYYQITLLFYLAKHPITLWRSAAFYKRRCEEFMQAFFSKNLDYESVCFDATTKDPYPNNFVMVPPQQKFEIRMKAFGFRAVAKTTTNLMNSWCHFTKPTLNCGKIFKN